MANRLRLLRFGTPVAMVAAASGYLFGTENGRKKIARIAYATEAIKTTSITIPPTQPPPMKYQYLPDFSEDAVRQKWDWNWDSREPKSLIDPVKYEEATEADREEMRKKVTSKTTRHIILIRHGQYHYDGDKCLTKLGREQAAFLGERLKASGLKFDQLIMSSLVRATETANIILESLPDDLSTSSDLMLAEGACYPPEPPLSHYRPQHKFVRDGARIEAAFLKYFHRAEAKKDVEGKKATFEVIVCHANVIRYFVCRALQLPPEAWLRISLANGSLTYLMIRPDGRVILKSMGDSGHLPPDKLSFA